MTFFGAFVYNALIMHLSPAVGMRAFFYNYSCQSVPFSGTDNKCPTRKSRRPIAFYWAE